MVFWFGFNVRSLMLHHHCEGRGGVKQRYAQLCRSRGWSVVMLQSGYALFCRSYGVNGSDHVEPDSITACKIVLKQGENIVNTGQVPNF